MQKGFSYIQALVVCSLSLLLFSFSFLILQSTIKLTHTQPEIIAPLLDMLSTDIRYAQAVSATGHELKITTAADQYRYTLLNQRLARIREGVLYLSPATPAIATFSVTTSDNRYFTLTLATKAETETRIVRRRNP